MLTALPAKVFFAAFVQPSLLQKGQTAFTAAIRRDRILFQTSHTVKMRLMGLVILLIREMKLRVIPEPVADLKVIPGGKERRRPLGNLFYLACRRPHIGHIGFLSFVGIIDPSSSSLRVRELMVMLIQNLFIGDNTLIGFLRTLFQRAEDPEYKEYRRYDEAVFHGICYFHVTCHRRVNDKADQRQGDNEYAKEDGRPFRFSHGPQDLRIVDASGIAGAGDAHMGI